MKKAPLVLSVLLTLVSVDASRAQDSRIAAACGASLPANTAFDDKTHELWYVRFWTGDCARSLSWCSAGKPNWLSMIDKMSSQVDAPRRELLKTKACALGYKIGLEWAKDNSIRSIDTNDLSRFYKDLNAKTGDPFTRMSKVDQAATALLQK